LPTPTESSAARRPPAGSGEPPGPRGYPVVGVMPRIWRDPLRFFQDVAREHGGLARVGLGRFTLYLVSDPELIGEVLVDPGDRFWKGEGLEVAARVMGQGLATSDGDLWRRQRRLVQPGFHVSRNAAHTGPVDALLRELVAAWRGRAEAFDLAAAANALSQRIIVQTLFGADLGRAEVRGLADAVDVASRHIDRRAWSFVPWGDRLPTPANRRFRRALATLDALVERLVAERRRSGTAGRTDVLSLLVDARDDDGAMSPRQLRDEVVTLFVAGHETTGQALAWTLHLLARHPDVWAAVAAEAATLPADGAPGADALRRLDLTGRVVKEGLRLYPPGWVIVRTPREAIELGGYALPAGAPLLLSQWVVHRRPELWTEPERFDPDRWLPERAAGRHRFAYFPYGGGRRLCIGHLLADQLLRHALARIAPALRLEAASDRPVSPQPLTTLRPRGGIPVRVAPGG